MKRLRLFGCIILYGLVTTLFGLESSVESSIRLFDAWVEARILDKDIPAAVVGIVHKDTLIWSKSYGEIDKEAVLPLGSLTKPLTAVAVLRLWQKGMLELDVPIQRYLPGFNVRGYNPSARPITIRMLLQHTSGLPQDPDFPFYNDLIFPDFQALWANIAEQQLVFSPGLSWKYSNTGYALLGKIIETVSGRPYEEYMYEEICKPLLMKQATFAPNFSSVPKGYSHKALDCKRKEIQPYKTMGLCPAMGLYAPLDEWGQLASFFLGKVASKTIISSPTRRYMLTSTVPMIPGARFGLGIALRRYSNILLIEHASQLPGYSSYISIDPFQQIGLVVFTACQQELTPWADAFVRWVSSGFAEKSQHAYSEEQARWKKFEGRYMGPEGIVYVVLHQGALSLYEPLSSNMLDRLVPTETEGLFQIRDGYTFNGSNGDFVQFEVASSGSVSSMKIANMYMYPVQ